MFQEYVLFRGWLMKLLSENLEQAKKDDEFAQDSRDRDAAIGAQAKVKYIEELIKQANSFRIIT